MIGFPFILFIILLLIMHLSVYFIFFRYILKTEQSIFGYHFLIFVLILLCSTFNFYLLPIEENFYTCVLACSIAAIYSLTFLELWTLSQISYSREILLKAKEKILNSNSSDTEELQQLGAKKRMERLSSLKNMGLLSEDQGLWSLTPKGKTIALSLIALLKISNLKDRG